MPLAHMKADVVLAIGGDGTILRALQLSDSKVLGINSGSLGFLAEVYAEEVDEYLDRIARGDYRVEERMRLKVTVDGERMFDCTNEAVVHTAQVAKIRHFETRLGAELESEFARMASSSRRRPDPPRTRCRRADQSWIRTSRRSSRPRLRRSSPHRDRTYSRRRGRSTSSW